MTTASVGGVVLAESDNTVIIEGNHYFPPDSINWDHFTSTDRTTGCPWKGTASYYSVNVNGTEMTNVAWTYHNPKDAAKEIKDHVAFWRGVEVETTPA